MRKTSSVVGEEVEQIVWLLGKRDSNAADHCTSGGGEDVEGAKQSYPLI